MYRIRCVEGVKVYVLYDTEADYPREYISDSLPEPDSTQEPIAEICVPKELYKSWQKSGFPELVY